MKVLKITIVCLTILLLFVFSFYSFSFFKIYKSAKDIDVGFENNLDKFVFLEFYDRDNVKTPLVQMDFCESEDILKHTFDAFIAKEDKRFYSHDGIDYRSILRASIINFKSRKALQGGSTITQQLAKNLVLSSEKKLSRKISEASLAKKIESLYTKEEILTMYLNVIYFGENTFGISDASMLYFGKKPAELTISESAMLAGIIASPENYSPVKSLEIATQKRDIVLALMKDQGYITEDEFETAISEKLAINITKNSNTNYDYFNHTIKEASDLLGTTESELCGKNYKIFTYIDTAKQGLLHMQGEENRDNDCVLLALDNNSGGVLGIFESCHDMILQTRSPASLIKPLLVYAPAIEENVIFENSILQDKKTDFDGYEPKNYLDIYYGDVTAKTALAKSLNVPSVKILQSLSIEKSKSYANRLNMPLSTQDNGLAIALGGLFKGYSPLQISGGFMTLANGGTYKKPCFVREIQDENGNIIYSREELESRVFGEDTAYIVTDMLKECTKNGTGKDLFEISPNIASKTGTNGDENGNIDAYSCCYTKDETFFCWLGNRDFSRMPSSVKGSSVPVQFAKAYFGECGEIEDFEKPPCVVTLSYDRDEYLKNGKLLQTTQDTPLKYIGKTLISKRYYPILKSLKYSYPRVFSPVISQSGDYIEIEFSSQDFAIYDIFDSKTATAVASVKGDGTTLSVVLPASGEYAEYSISASNAYSGKKGERYVFEKLYLQKNFMPKTDSKQSEIQGKDMPITDEDILEFFS